jgi:hypothetical protein
MLKVYFCAKQVDGFDVKKRFHKTSHRNRVYSSAVWKINHLCSQKYVFKLHEQVGIEFEKIIYFY